MDDAYAVLDFAVVSQHFVYPLSEAGEVGGDAGCAECAALQRRVAPGFVVGGVDAQVVGRQEIVVGHIEYAIVSVQIAGDEQDFDRVACSGSQPQMPHHAEDAVLVHIVKRMRYVGVRQWFFKGFFPSVQPFLQVAARSFHPAGHFNQCKDLGGGGIGRAVCFQSGVELGQSFHIYVEALASEVITPAGRNYQHVVLDGCARQGFHGADDLCPCGFALASKLYTFGHKFCFKSVGQDDVGRFIQ